MFLSWCYVTYCLNVSPSKAQHLVCLARCLNNKCFFLWVTVNTSHLLGLKLISHFSPHARHKLNTYSTSDMPYFTHLRLEQTQARHHRSRSLFIDSVSDCFRAPAYFCVKSYYLGGDKLFFGGHYICFSLCCWLMFFLQVIDVSFRKIYR